MKADERLSRHVHSFFHEYLTRQRNVSPHTLLSSRDTIKLFLSFASRRLSVAVVALRLDDLTADLEQLDAEKAEELAESFERYKKLSQETSRTIVRFHERRIAQRAQDGADNADKQDAAVKAFLDKASDMTVPRPI